MPSLFEMKGQVAKFSPPGVKINLGERGSDGFVELLSFLQFNPDTRIIKNPINRIIDT